MITSLEVICNPTENTLVPHSTGHLLYSATLNSIQKTNPELSQKIHESQISKVSVSPLKGEFDPKDRNRKRIFSDTEYRFFINLVNTEGFQELFNDLVLSEQGITVGDAELQIKQLQTEEKDWTDLMEKKTPRELYFHFMSPVCIKYKDSEVTEMFPHREAVFNALLNSWNRNAPEQMQFELDEEELKKHVIEKSFEHDTANTVVTRKNDRAIKAFGFTGRTQYGFKNASDQLKKKLGILTRYSQYAGIGSHTARGLGNTYTEVKY